MTQELRAALAILISIAAPAWSQETSLEAGFLAPPPQAYPGGGLGIATNEQAIRGQLERQKELGISNVGAGSNGAPGAYMSEGWKAAIASTVATSEAMGFEVSFLTSPGFSHTGDSKVQPHEAMRKLVWTQTNVVGGKPFKAVLAAPANNSGPYQNIPYFNESPWTLAIDREFYRDIAVIAYRVASPEAVTAQPVVTSSNGPVDAAKLLANDPRNPLQLDSSHGAPWLELDYSSAQTVRSVVLATPETLFEDSVVADLSAKMEEGTYRKIATFDMRSAAQVTRSFPAVRSTSFRLTFSRLPQNVEPLIPKGGSDMAPPAAGSLPFGPKRPPTVFAISALTLSSEGRVNEAERKAGFFTFVNDYYALATDPTVTSDATAKADVIDLTQRMQPDGTLSWTPPAGNWRVLRIGASLTGKINHPAPPDATGLEVDKLSATHMANYFNRYLDGLLPAGDARQAVTTLFADSIESGPQNWTDDMFAEFQRRRGYDMRPFLPAITGAIIGNAAVTDKFLWDFRQTIADLMHENTYGKMAGIAKSRGLKMRVQALEQARHQLGDDFEMRRYADEPMGALWGSADPVVDYLKAYPNQVADQRGAASVAHIYGRKIAAAESGTTLSYPGAFSPRVLKQIVDLEFAIGINWLSRGAPMPHDLWSGYAGNWVNYLARTSYMLQQGRYVADVAYFFGQDAPLVTLRERLADAPLAHGFDYINTQALLDLVSVRDGKLTTPSGMEYRVLQLGGSSRMMTLNVLRRLRDLVQAGLVVAGPSPLDTPSLADDAQEFRRIRDELWGADGQGRTVGRGRVYGGGTIDAALAAEKIAPDVMAQPAKVGDTILFQHRALDGTDFYFVTYRSDRPGAIELSFRQTDKTPQLWRATTGERTQLSYRIENGRTIVPIDAAANDAMFIVFRTPAKTNSYAVPHRTPRTLSNLDSGWSVRFAGKDSLPAPVSLAVGSWAEQADPVIKYFAGTATYSRTVDVPKQALDAASSIILDLGEVQDIADVSVNGAAVDVRWTPPYSFDITRALKPGKNTIDVKVTNRAVNGLIGAARSKSAPPSPFGGYKPDAPLRASGLIGPARLLVTR